MRTMYTKTMRYWDHETIWPYDHETLRLGDLETMDSVTLRESKGTRKMVREHQCWPALSLFIHTISIHYPSNVHPMSMKYSYCHPSLMVSKDDCHEIVITQWFSSSMVLIIIIIIIIRWPPWGCTYSVMTLSIGWFSVLTIVIKGDSHQKW